MADYSKDSMSQLGSTLQILMNEGNDENLKACTGIIQELKSRFTFAAALHSFDIYSNEFKRIPKPENFDALYAIMILVQAYEYNTISFVPSKV